MHAPSDANMTKPDLVLPADYADWLASLNQRIASAQQRAITAANKELVLLYWQIGQQILVRQERQGWGAQVVDHLAKDLAVAFPAMKGFSLRNRKVHACIRRRMARTRLCAAGCGTIAVVS